jgi:hypothetical protein
MRIALSLNRKTSIWKPLSELQIRNAAGSAAEIINRTSVHPRAIRPRGGVFGEGFD